MIRRLDERARGLSANLLRILDQQGPYEVFGNLGHITEIFIVELVLACGDVRVSLLFVLAQERRRAAQEDIRQHPDRPEVSA